MCVCVGGGDGVYELLSCMYTVGSHQISARPVARGTQLNIDTLLDTKDAINVDVVLW